MHKLYFAIVFLVVSSVGNAADLGKQFVTAKLSYGASVSVPKSWQILRGNEMRAIETSVGAAIDLAGYAKQFDGGEILIVANLPDPQLYAGMTITTLSTPSLTPALPASLTDAQVKASEATIRQAVETMQARIGTKVFGWSPLRKIVIGRNTAMYTSYLRSSAAGERKVHLYKFFGSGRVYDLALTTSVAHESFNGVVLEKIAHSFMVP